MKKTRLTNLEVAQILEDFLDGKGGQWAWDDFTLGMSLEDEQLEQIRKRCVGLSWEFPSSDRHKYCNEQGLEVIREYIKQLRDQGSR